MNGRRINGVRAFERDCVFKLLYPFFYEITGFIALSVITPFFGEPLKPLTWRHSHNNYEILPIAQPYRICTSLWLPLIKEVIVKWDVETRVRFPLLVVFWFLVFWFFGFCDFVRFVSCL